VTVKPSNATSNDGARQWLANLSRHQVPGPVDGQVLLVPSHRLRVGQTGPSTGGTPAARAPALFVILIARRVEGGERKPLIVPQMARFVPRMACTAPVGAEARGPSLVRS